MPLVTRRQKQTAYDEGHPDALAESLQTEIQIAMYRYLREDLGLPESVSRDRADAEISGRVGKAFCDACENASIRLAGNLVLDLGSGLGALSEELARRHARPVALEPGAAWRRLAAKRISAAGSGWTVGAVGESLPFSDNTFDLILSHQVLEHVENPAAVIREAYRVLKPGGYIFLAYENYLSFWEPHYRIRWLPLLPKPIGALYLKALGRNPRFLRESITYTTFPAVRRTLLATGFRCMRIKIYDDALHSPKKNGLKWRLLKSLTLLGNTVPLAVLTSVDYLRRAFHTAASECMQKPL
ncbi:MAG: class I SAM-dependent methyltransferase [Alphaproteobacteria bacterium]